MVEAERLGVWVGRGGVAGAPNLLPRSAAPQGCSSNLLLRPAQQQPAALACGQHGCACACAHTHMGTQTYVKACEHTCIRTRSLTWPHCDGEVQVSLA